MEKQNSLVIQVLQRLSEHGLFDQMLLIGSWGAYFYKYYFNKTEYFPTIKTRDIDFLLPRPPKPFKANLDLASVLSDLNFEIDHVGSQGVLRLVNAELILELLIPEVGKGNDKPYPLPQLKFNAQPLRHLTMLLRNPIEVNIEGTKIKLPHPADYCLHKLIILNKRKTHEKRSKDLDSALKVFNALVESKQTKALRESMKGLFPKEKQLIIKTLESSCQEGLVTDYNFLISSDLK